MTHTTRRLLFYFIVALFLVIAPLTILYSSGFRFDFSRFAIKETGGLFVRTPHRDTRILLNDTITRRTSLLSNRVLVSGLAPDTYRIVIEKDGYYSWEKNLPVKEGIVTELFDITLIKRDIAPVPIFEEVGGVWASDDFDRVLFTVTTSTAESLQGIKPAEPARTQLFTAPIAAPQLRELVATYPFRATLKDVAVSPDNERAFFRLHTPTTTRLIVQPLQRGGAPIDFWRMVQTANAARNIPYAEILRSGAPTKFTWHPRDARRIYFLKNNALFVLNTASRTLQKISVRPTNTYTALGNRLWQADTNGGAFGYSDLNGTNITTLLATTSAAIVSIIPSSSGTAFIDADATLWFLSEGTRDPLRVADNVHRARFSPDTLKLLYWNEYDIGMFYIEEWYLGPDIPYRQEFSSDQLMHTDEPILDVWWHQNDSLHFTVLEKNRLSFAEIDGRDKRNVFTIIEPSDARSCFYNPRDEQLYYFDTDTLYSINFGI